MKIRRMVPSLVVPGLLVPLMVDEQGVDMKPHELANSILAVDRAKAKAAEQTFLDWWNDAMPELNHRTTLKELCRAAFKAGSDAVVETLRLKSTVEVEETR